jgi:hypothetical protein|tara:strand:+ start:321 stop:1976 length:1656 start_codon:yes stop_codon:yes gene_type:complete
MSLNTLLESANPYHSVQSDAARLANKWEKTGLLEGMSGANKSNMGIILENQAKQLVVESSNTGGGAGSGTFTAGTGAQWAGVALPLVRKVFGQIAAKEFVSVQPMNLPSGLVFYLDFQYGTDKAPFGKGESLYGNTGTNPSTLPFGNTNTGGLYGAGRYGYSINLTSSVLANAALSSGSATMTDICWDSSLSSSVALGPQAVGGLALLTVLTSSINANFDQEALKSFYLIGANAPTIANQYPQFTKFASNGADLEFVVPSNSVIPGTNSALSYSLAPLDNERGDFEDGNNNLNGQNTPIKIPEINVQMQSSAIVAKTRKLKAVWTPEFAQDLNAYHALDAEAELTSILSEYISLEIDLEILDMLVESAAAGTEVWSAVNNRSISGTGNGTVSSLGFYNSQGQWFQTLGTKIQKLSNIIHQKTLRGGANFMVISPTIGTILESIPGYAADADGDVSAATYAFGVQKVGAFNGRYKVYKNPYMTDNCMLLGFRGAQFLETGAVFAPYIPLIMTPLVYDPETFTPRKGLMTRYAKKMVRPEFYGKIMINGLETL